MATLAMTALSNAASVRGVAITRQQDLHEEDRHTPSVAPTTINDMFAQDLANSSDELPESWEDKDQNSISISPSQSVEREIISTQPHSSKANVIDLPPQEATLSAAAASLDLDSATNIVTPISTSSFPSPPRSPDTIRGNPATSSMDSTLNTYNISSRSANYELDTDQQNKKQDDAPTDDLDAIMMGDRSKSIMPSSSRKQSQVSVASGILSDHSSSAFDWSSFTTPSSTFSTDTVQGTSRAQLLDKFPDVEEAEESFEENHRIAAKLQAAADHARVHDEEQRARQRTKQTALEEMMSRSSKLTAASAVSLQSQHKYGLNVRLGQRAATAQTVYVSPSGDFDTLPAAIHSGSLNIILEEGTHVVDSTIVLGQHQAGISIRGVSKTNKSIVKFVGRESAFVVFNSHNVVLSNIVIDAMDSKNLAQDEEGFDGQMWQVVGVVNSSQVGIIDCTIRSPSSMHAIFFAG